jgi:hypothetical protein
MVEDQEWYFGLMREAGGYRIVASGPKKAGVWQAMAHIAVATMVVTRDDLPDLCIGETELRRWLPNDSARSSVQGQGISARQPPGKGEESGPKSACERARPS